MSLEAYRVHEVSVYTTAVFGGEFVLGEGGEGEEEGEEEGEG